MAYNVLSFDAAVDAIGLIHCHTSYSNVMDLVVSSFCFYFWFVFINLHLILMERNRGAHQKLLMCGDLFFFHWLNVATKCSAVENELKVTQTFNIMLSLLTIRIANWRCSCIVFIVTFAIINNGSLIDFVCYKQQQQQQKHFFLNATSEEVGFLLGMFRNNQATVNQLWIFLLICTHKYETCAAFKSVWLRNEAAICWGIFSQGEWRSDRVID